MTKQKLLLALMAFAVVTSTVAMAAQFGIVARLNWKSKEPTSEQTSASVVRQPQVVRQQSSKLSSSPSLGAMLEAFDRILGLSEEQKSKVVHANQKAFEHINQTRQRVDIDGFAKKHEVNRLTKFRDERILRVLSPEQLSKWEHFVQGKEAINSLKKTNDMKVPYERGEKKFYPESEYGEFTSLEQIKTIIADKEAIIAASGFSAKELEQLHNILYNFN